jgi:hypothetical protein
VTQGAPGPRVAPRAGFGAVVDDLMRRAQRDGQAQEELTDYTELVEGARRLRLGVLEPELAPGVIGEALQPASPAERRLVAQVFAQYAATVHPGPLVTQASLQIKDVARHLGAG